MIIHRYLQYNIGLSQHTEPNRVDTRQALTGLRPFAHLHFVRQYFHSWSKSDNAGRLTLIGQISFTSSFLLTVVASDTFNLLPKPFVIPCSFHSSKCFEYYQFPLLNKYGKTVQTLGR